MRPTILRPVATMRRVPAPGHRHARELVRVGLACGHRAHFSLTIWMLAGQPDRVYCAECSRKARRAARAAS